VIRQAQKRATVYFLTPWMVALFFLDQKGNVMKQLFKTVAPWLTVVFLILSLLLCGGMAAAEEAAEILPISSVPAVFLYRPLVSDRVEMGTIDRIDKKGVVVCDSFMFFSPSVVFLSASQKPTSSSRFKPGTAVGVRLNSKNKIVAMWIDTGRIP